MFIVPKLSDSQTNIIYGIRLTYDRSHEYRYVGLSYRGVKRLREHIWDSRQKSHPYYNSEKSKWLRYHHYCVTFDILQICETESELDFYEKMWIQILKERGHRLLNKSIGGRSSSPTEATKLRMSLAATGRKHTEESKQKMSETKKAYGLRGKDHYLSGTTWSEDTRAKLSKYKGENHWAYGKGGKDHHNYGRKHTPEQGQKISKALKGKPKPAGFAEAASKRMTGTKMSEETKLKLSNKLKGTENKGRHTRWHTNRGIVDTNCVFCPN